MDVVLKGGSLLATQIVSVARVLLAFPAALLAALWPWGREDGGGGSCVFYEGVVTHARKRPVANAFEYPVRVALVDLDGPPPWFACAQARDHLTADGARAFAGTDGPVLLLTNPVSAGYTQNPISVYYCYAADDDTAGAAGAATPRSAARSGGATPAAGTPAAGTPGSAGLRTRRQRRLEEEALAAATAAAGDDQQQQQQRQQQRQRQAREGRQPGAGGPEGRLEAAMRCAPALAIAEVTNTPWGDRVRFVFRPGGDQTPKALHVSPFMDMDNTCFGFMPHRVAFWIYWQAVVLIAKGCPVHLKPEGRDFQGRAAQAATRLPRIGGGKGGGGGGSGGGGGGDTDGSGGGGGCPFSWTDTRAWPWYL
ncbi:hypothetical protein Rsub_12055 [Raphidocelis subcapitata]|uniref:Uncharacterized protein n=1 Tax=Raphidocelis subcapitata TaxID=307507 RepID=A0A2V0PQ24_9CHLO|nr:hypothetical protein Rsub_12055 [Raphidocelis subcapitata]|eukprot:GBF99295.1 hypothetical protein Rsub_12055 [Raphidocelis subcapitata]